MISAFLNFALLAAIVFGIAKAIGALRRTDTGFEPDEPTDVREAVARLFRLGLLAATLVLTAEGIAGLVGEAIPRSGTLSRDPAELARALAFTVVGVPAALGLAAWTRRKLAPADANADAELRSGGWGLYLFATLTVSLLVALAAWHSVAAWAVAADDLDGDAVGRALSWTALWALHWPLARRRSAALGVPAGRAEPYLLAGSAIGLVSLALGTGLAAARALDGVYEDRYFDVLVSGTGVRDRVAEQAVLAALGGATWVWYWVRHARNDGPNPRWHAYVLLLGVLGGLATAVVGGARLAHAVGLWIFGRPDASTAAAHFSSVPGAAVTLVVGAALWWYHRSVLDLHPASERTEADRIYDYLAAAVGLVTATVGVIVAFVALIEALAGPESAVDRSPLANTVVLAATLVLVGAPVWTVFWFGVQRRTARASEAARVAELGSISRRVHLLALFGVAAVAALVALVVLLIGVFEDIAEGRAGTETVFRVRVAAGIVAGTGVVAAYHAVVFREDRAALPAARPALARPEVLVIATGAPALARELASNNDLRVRAWEVADRAPAVGAGLDLDGVAVALRDGPPLRLVVVERADGSYDVIAIRS